MREIAVIIPFYQEKRGILSKAVASAIAQPLPAGVSLWIIVVDDKSPVTAEREMAEMQIPDDVKLTVQPVERNGGPGAARNIGLDAARAGGASYCAFLDSDDVWLGSHLSNAVEMIDQGADAYFSDHRRVGDYDSAFVSGTPVFWNSPAVQLARDSKSDESKNSGRRFTLPASTIRSSLVFEYLFQTSTVVFCLQAAGQVRFDTRLKSAGEDHLFWFDVASAVQTFAISSEVEVECGYGINLYFDSFSWTSPRSVSRFGHRFVMFKEMGARGHLNVGERAHLRAEAAAMRNTYVYLLLRHMARGTLPDWGLLRLVALKALRR